MQYLELARALSAALELGDGQLSGGGSLKHLPPQERERLGSLRQRDLELLRTRLSLLQSQAQRREELLQEYHRDMGSLRYGYTLPVPPRPNLPHPAPPCPTLPQTALNCPTRASLTPP